MAVRDNQPLRALGEQSVDPAGAAMAMEFVAPGNHCEVIRAETARTPVTLTAMMNECVRMTRTASS